METLQRHYQSYTLMLLIPVSGRNALQFGTPSSLKTKQLNINMATFHDAFFFPKKKKKGGAAFTSSKYLKQMAISKQASSIFVDTTPLFKLLLFRIFAIIMHTVTSFEYQINY